VPSTSATPDPWASVEHWGSQGALLYQCLLELRTRVEQLEANTKQWRTDHLRLANTCASLAPDRLQFFNALLPDDEDSAEGGSLVERVARAIGRDDEPINWEPEARAAIREVAAWMRESDCGYNAVRWLEQEVNR
jgi:hypothetical protein